MHNNTKISLIRASENIQRFYSAETYISTLRYMDLQHRDFMSIKYKQSDEKHVCDGCKDKGNGVKCNVLQND